MSNSFIFPLRSFLFIFFFEMKCQSSTIASQLFICPEKPCFLPLVQWRCLGYSSFSCNTSGNLHMNKGFDIMALLLHQFLPISYSQKSKYSLKYTYFNSDLSRTIWLSLVQCVCLKTCPKLQEFRVVSLQYKHNNLRYVL